jgi:hypothetical protein
VTGGACEFGNDPLIFIKCGEFLDKLRNSAFQEGMCSMELYVHIQIYIYFVRHYTKIVFPTFSDMSSENIVLTLPDYWLEVSIRKVLQPATSAQDFLGFPVSKSEC